MGIIGKLEVDIEIQSCGDLFHELLGSKPHVISDLNPDVHACDLHEGEFGKPGAVINWNYTLDGKKCVAKEIVEVIDEEKRYVRYKIIEGDVLNEFKSLTLSVQVIPNKDLTMVKWIAEFEKIHDDGPYPTKVIDLCLTITKDIEAHHTESGEPVKSVN